MHREVSPGSDPQGTGRGGRGWWSPASRAGAEESQRAKAQRCRPGPLAAAPGVGAWPGGCWERSPGWSPGERPRGDGAPGRVSSPG